jgi:hypothetical protein
MGDESPPQLNLAIRFLFPYIEPQQYLPQLRPGAFLAYNISRTSERRISLLDSTPPWSHFWGLDPHKARIYLLGGSPGDAVT